MPSGKCPNPKCQYPLEKVQAKAAEVYLEVDELSADKTGKIVWLLICPDCGQYLGVVNKQD